MPSEPHRPLLPRPGEIVAGRFRIVEAIGRGGFSTVYKAHQESIGRDVAVKFLSPDVAADPTSIERFRREALHISQLRHPNTIRLYDYGRTAEGLFYMVMELAEGRPLSEMIAAEGGLGQHRAAHILEQVCLSLAEAHAINIVHRDLKPENILVCNLHGEADVAKVLDFGLAKAVGWRGEAALTGKGKVFGTPMYMAPEQVCGEETTVRSDVYALALLLFEVVTGRPPVERQSRQAILRAQLNDPVPLLTPELATSPLGPIILRAASKEPAKRYADAGELLQALKVASASLSPAPLTTRAVAGESPVTPSVHPSAEMRRSEAPTPVEIPQMHRADPDGPVLLSPDAVKELPEGRALLRTPRLDPGAFGRVEELTALQEFTRQLAQSETRHIAVCFGAAGAGKSRLLRVWRAWAAGLDATPPIGTGHCRMTASHPLDPVREAINSLLGAAQTTAQEVLASLPKPVSTDPATLRYLTGQDGEEQSTLDGGRLLAGLGRVILGLAAQRPVILVLDDMDQATGAICGLVSDLLVATRGRPVPLGIVLAGRRQPAGENPELRALLSRLDALPDGEVLGLTLGPMDRDACDRFVAHLIDGSDDLKSRIYQLSQGNPLFAVQALRFFRDRDLLEERNGEWQLRDPDGSGARISGRTSGTASPHLLELLALRIDQAVDRHTHFPGLKLVMQWLALLGQRAPVALLQQALEIDPSTPESERLEREIDVLVHEGLVARDWDSASPVLADVRSPEDPANADSDGTLRASLVVFDHLLVREALLQELGRLKSASRLHRRAAEAKLAWYRSQVRVPPLVEIADHYEAAGDRAEHRSYLERAAVLARHRLERLRARELFLRLLRELDDGTDPRGTGRRDAWLALGALCEELGDVGPADDYYRLAADSAGDANKPRERAEAILGRARVRLQQNQLDAARPLALDAIETYDAAGDTNGLVEALITLSELTERSGDPDAALAAQERLRLLQPAIVDAHTAGRVWLHLGDAAKRRGDLDAWEDHLQEALTSFETCDDLQGVSDVLTGLGFLAIQRHRPEAAIPHLERALQLKESIADRRGTGIVHNHLGVVAFRQGDTRTADEHLRLALEIFEAIGAPYRVGLVNANLGLVRLSEGKYTQSHDCFDRAISIMESIGDELSMSVCLTNQGLVALCELDRDRARDLFREARRLIQRAGSRFGRSEVLSNLAFVAAWDGEFDAAERILRELLAEDLPPHDAATALATLGAILTITGRNDEAVMSLTRATDAAEETRNGELLRFCHANTAFYAAATGQDALYQATTALVAREGTLCMMPPAVWLTWLDDMAQHSARADALRAAVDRLREHWTPTGAPTHE